VNQAAFARRFDRNLLHAWWFLLFIFLVETLCSRQPAERLLPFEDCLVNSVQQSLTAETMNLRQCYVVSNKAMKAGFAWILVLL
jgi:hypothetical protein